MYGWKHRENVKAYYQQVQQLCRSHYMPWTLFFIYFILFYFILFPPALWLALIVISLLSLENFGLLRVFQLRHFPNVYLAVCR